MFLVRWFGNEVMLSADKGDGKCLDTFLLTFAVVESNHVKDTTFSYLKLFLLFIVILKSRKVDFSPPDECSPGTAGFRNNGRTVFPLMVILDLPNLSSFARFRYSY